MLLDVFRKESKLAMAAHEEKVKAREAAQRLKDEKERAEREARQKEMDDNKICDITDEEAAAIIKEEEDKLVRLEYYQRIDNWTCSYLF